MRLRLSGEGEISVNLSHLFRFEELDYSMH